MQIKLQCVLQIATTIGLVLLFPFQGNSVCKFLYFEFYLWLHKKPNLLKLPEEYIELVYFLTNLFFLASWSVYFILWALLGSPWALERARHLVTLLQATSRSKFTFQAAELRVPIHIQ